MQQKGEKHIRNREKKEKPKRLKNIGRGQLNKSVRWRDVKKREEWEGRKTNAK